LGGITADGSASVTCDATFEASAYAVYDFTGSVDCNAVVVCNGVRVGDNWSNVPVSTDTWADVSQNDNTWSESSVGSNSWSDVASNSNTWAQTASSSNTWLRQ
jgi:hypothetical protein